MKRLKKLFVNIIAVLMLVLTTLSLSACEDIKTLEVKVNVNGTEYSIDVDLYKHLAPKTCAKIIELANNGYYNDSVFYMNGAYDSQYMVGDYKLSDDALIQNLIDNKLPSEIYGEFDKNGTVGSDLTNTKGAVGLWRSYYASNDKFYVNNSDAMDSGRATIYLPSSDMTKYNGYFCVFGVIDLENEESTNFYSALATAFAGSANYTEYVVYFTGDYDTDKADENYGLTYHAMKKTDYDELEKTVEDGVTTLTASDEVIFKAKGDELVCFNTQTLKVLNNAKIVSITTK